MKNKWMWLLWLSSMIGGCIGTDLVDDPLGIDQSQLEISDASVSLALGETFQLDATYINRLGEEAPADLIWMSQNEAVATVDGEGLVTGVGEGQTSVRVSNGEGLRDSALVVVFLDPQAVASVSIQGDAPVLAVGQSIQLTAVVRNGVGTVLPGESVSWTSSAPQVVSITDAGLVTALTPGVANVTARANGISSPPLIVQVSAGDRSGVFTGRNGYNVNGGVTLVTSSEPHQVRLAGDFSAQNGPGLHVYLGKSGTSGTGGVDLGSLQSTTGEQVYDIPESVDPDDFDFVLIYCQPFSVVFGSAELQ